MINDYTPSDPLFNISCRSTYIDDSVEIQCRDLLWKIHLHEINDDHGQQNADRTLWLSNRSNI